MNATRQTRRWISIPHDADRVNHPLKTKQGDQIVIDLEDISRANPTSRFRKEFVTQFLDLLDRVGKWLDGYAEKIDRAYLSFGSGQIDFVVILKSTQFDRAFDEAFVEFDIKIAKSARFDLIRLEFLSLPHSTEEGVAAFVPSQGSLVRRFA